jgi:hypothetical protein
MNEFMAPEAFENCHSSCTFQDETFYLDVELLDHPDLSLHPWKSFFGVYEGIYRSEKYHFTP